MKSLTTIFVCSSAICQNLVCYNWKIWPIPQQVPKVPIKNYKPATGFIPPRTALHQLRNSLLNQSLDAYKMGEKNPKELELVVPTIISVLAATSIHFPRTWFSSFTIHTVNEFTNHYISSQ